MRLQRLGICEQQNNMRRLHRVLNRRFYNGELSEVIDFDVAYTHDDTWAVFRSSVVWCRESAAGLETMQTPAIIFDREFVDELAKLDSARQEINAAADVMLHEMAHQYCHEHGIDDHDHGEVWKAVARAHGLEDPNEETEHLSANAQFSILNFWWKT